MISIRSLAVAVLTLALLPRCALIEIDHEPAPLAEESCGGGAGPSDVGSCACDPALPLCPVAGACATPGGFTLPGNESCGSAQYCAPCCDPADPCAARGTCKVTKIAQVPCSKDYECCSGVCDGICQGGCGVVLSF